MAKLALYLGLLISAACIIAAPWVTAVTYSFISLLQPQHVWFWVFDGFPAFKVFAGLAILGLGFATLKGLANFSLYRDKQNILLLILWLWVHLSDVFSPFQQYWAAIRSDLVLSTLDSIMIMYFVLLPLLYNKKALMSLTYVMVMAGLYYAYWANSAYFNAEWYKFMNNRLMGPAGSPYRDGNTLSVLLVMAIPFIAFYFFTAKKWWLKWGAILTLPFIWHALFLFSSRGALLSSLVVIAGIALIVKSKKFNMAIGIGFLLFLVQQGGEILSRTTTTISVAQSGNDEPINPRITSWTIGLKLIPKYPLFGAGVQRFQMASATHFPGKSPHVAHNTFLQFAANSGLIAGFIFLYLNYNTIKWLRRKNRAKLNIHEPVDYCILSSALGMLGFFVCSLFLDLIIYEPFYFCLLVHLVAVKIKQKQSTVSCVDEDLIMSTTPTARAYVLQLAGKQ